MAKNIASRRAAKAQRRKAIVAQKRRTEIEAGSIAGQVRAALANPIQHCLLSDGLFDAGMGMLVLSRGTPQSGVTMATFLLDTYALGVKDAFLRSLGRHEFAAYVDRMSFASPMLPVEPSYARKLLHDLTAWSRSIGFNPHPDYARIEPIFGATNATASDAEFQFGRGGKPLFIGEAPGGIEFSLDSDGELTIDTGDAVYSVEARLLEHDSPTAPQDGTN